MSEGRKGWARLANPPPKPKEDEEEKKEQLSGRVDLYFNMSNFQYEIQDAKMMNQQLTFERTNLQDVLRKTSTLESNNQELDYELSKLQEQIESARKTRGEKKASLDQQINETTSRVDGQMRVIESLQIALDETNNSKDIVSQNHLNQERELSTLNNKNDHLRIYKYNILKEYDTLHLRINESIPIGQTRRFICESCIKTFDGFCRTAIIQSLSTEPSQSNRKSTMISEKEKSRPCCNLM